MLPLIWRMGLAVVAGLVVSPMLTLHITPVIYIYLERFAVWRQWRRPEAVAVVGGGSEVAAK